MGLRHGRYQPNCTAASVGRRIRSWVRVAGRVHLDIHNNLLANPPPILRVDKRENSIAFPRIEVPCLRRRVLRHQLARGHFFLRESPHHGLKGKLRRAVFRIFHSGQRYDQSAFPLEVCVVSPEEAECFVFMFGFPCHGYSTPHSISCQCQTCNCVCCPVSLRVQSAYRWRLPCCIGRSRGTSFLFALFYTSFWGWSLYSNLRLRRSWRGRRRGVWRRCASLSIACGLPTAPCSVFCGMRFLWNASRRRCLAGIGML